MGEVVVTQSCQPAEAALAHVADVRLVLAVLFEVGFQQEACFKRFAALLADEGADLAVTGLAMDAECVGSVRAVVALFALVWLQTCVLGHVILQLVHPLALVSALRA